MCCSHPSAHAAYSAEAGSSPPHLRNHRETSSLSILKHRCSWICVSLPFSGFSSHSYYRLVWPFLNSNKFQPWAISVSRRCPSPAARNPASLANFMVNDKLPQLQRNIQASMVIQQAISTYVLRRQCTHRTTDSKPNGQGRDGWHTQLCGKGTG